jgi:hypothetical protein
MKPMNAMDEIPRRAYLDKMVPAELKIRDAMLAVEAMPADVRLTDAVVLLEQASTKVSDYVDSLPTPPVTQGWHAEKKQP